LGQDDPVHHDPIPPARPSRPNPAAAGSTTGWFVLLWLAWVVVPVGLFMAALGSLLTFLGELPTEAEEAQATRLLVLAAVAAVAIPATGLIMSLRAGRQGSAAAFVVAGGLSLVGAVLLVVGMAQSEPGSAVPVHDPGGACQEYSGGDTRCPGG
jgi:hypothetical protein